MTYVNIINVDKIINQRKDMIIMEESWEETIDRLVGYMADRTLTEYDYNEVAERFGTSREEVIDACILRQTEIDMENGKIKNEEDDYEYEN